MAKILVFGNEKGGAGKSTLAMHVATGLLLSGQRVGIIDLDLRQQSLRRFFENRDGFRRSTHAELSMPQVMDFTIQTQHSTVGSQVQELVHHIAKQSDQVDFIMIDCPGALTPLSETAHQLADCLVTPMNDSFIDFDLLANIDQDGETIKTVSVYAEMVWKARQMRATKHRPAIDWVVVRNRLPSQHMHNKRKVGAALDQLAKRIGFRLIPGLSDRVAYKELFPRGLTVADDPAFSQLAKSMSNITARQELRDVIHGLNLDIKLGF